MLSLTAEHCVAMVETVIAGGPGTKMWVCTGDRNEAEKWRLRLYRIIKDFPEIFKNQICTERKKIGEDLYEVQLLYIDESKLPRFVAIKADGTEIVCQTPNERRIEKMKKEEKDNIYDLTWE